MDVIVLKSDSDNDTKLLLQLAKKMGMAAKKLSVKEVEDAALANAITEGMKTPKVSRTAVFDVLKKR